MDRYRKRLEKDLDRWIADGLVDSANRQAMLDRIAPGGMQWSASGAAAIMGACLLGLAILTFIAANWAALSPIARLGVMIVIIWGTFSSSAMAFARAHASLGHAFALIGVIAFGGAIILTAQSFNISAFRNTGVLIWTCGALLTAIVLPSRPVLILSGLLGSAWVILESVNPYAPDILWGYVLVWLVTAVLANRLESKATWHLITIGLLIWVGYSLWQMGDRGTLTVMEVQALYTLMAGSLAITAISLWDRDWLGTGLLGYWAATVSLLMAWTLQFSLMELSETASDQRWADIAGTQSPSFLIPAFISAGVISLLTGLRLVRQRIPLSLGAAIILASVSTIALPFLARIGGPDLVFALRLGVGALIYAVSITLILQGQSSQKGFLGGLGIALFILQTLYIYTVLFGSLMNTAVFFLVGGLLLIGLSMGLTRLQRRMSDREQAQETSS